MFMCNYIPHLFTCFVGGHAGIASNGKLSLMRLLHNESSVLQHIQSKNVALHLSPCPPSAPHL